MDAIKQTFQRCKAQNKVSSVLSHPSSRLACFIAGHDIGGVSITDMMLIQQAALVTYVTAGFPQPQDTPDILLSMEKGGSGTFTNQPCSVLRIPLKSDIRCVYLVLRYY